jgi:hypothetical protein
VRPARDRAPIIEAPIGGAATPDPAAAAQAVEDLVTEAEAVLTGLAATPGRHEIRSPFRAS